MSTVTAESVREHRVTLPTLRRRKRRGEKITMLTAYDFTFAQIFDTAGIDVLLVGDSLGNVVQGQETTLPVTLDETLYHTRLVARGARRALVVAFARQEVDLAAGRQDLARRRLPGHRRDGRLRLGLR